MKGFTKAQKTEIGNAFPFTDTITFTIAEGVPVVKVEKVTSAFLNYDAFKAWTILQLRRVGLFGAEIGDYKLNGVTDDGYEIHLSVEWER